METRKVNVMGKEMQIPKGMTFGELAKEFEGEVSVKFWWQSREIPCAN